VKRCKSRSAIGFLLKKPSFDVAKTRRRGQFGPVLSETNAQVYFRLVSGMILKETMKQMKMDAIKARLLVEKSGTGLENSIDMIPIEEIGDLRRVSMSFMNSGRRNPVFVSPFTAC